MIQQEKELLLKDLSARLPYGLKVRYETPEFDGCILNLKGIDVSEETINIGSDYTNCKSYPITDREGNLLVKPYLRSMSTMTEEEKREFFEISGFNCYDGLFICKKLAKRASFIGGTIDWLNAHHFDHRGLIPKGLALEALKGMYNL